MKKFWKFQALLSGVFALVLLFCSSSLASDPAALLIRELFFSLSIFLASSLLLLGQMYRYDPLHSVAFYAFSSLNLLVGVLSVYLLYTAYDQGEAWFEVALSVFVALISISLLKSLSVPRSYRSWRQGLNFFFLSFGQIVVNGLMAWLAIEFWLA